MVFHQTFWRTLRGLDAQLDSFENVVHIGRKWINFYKCSQKPRFHNCSHGNLRYNLQFSIDNYWWMCYMCPVSVFNCKLITTLTVLLQSTKLLLALSIYMYTVYHVHLISEISGCFVIFSWKITRKFCWRLWMDLPTMFLSITSLNGTYFSFFVCCGWYKKVPKLVDDITNKIRSISYSKECSLDQICRRHFEILCKFSSETEFGLRSSLYIFCEVTRWFIQWRRPSILQSSAEQKLQERGHGQCVTWRAWLLSNSIWTDKWTCPFVRGQSDKWTRLSIRREHSVS